MARSSTCQQTRTSTPDAGGRDVGDGEAQYTTARTIAFDEVAKIERDNGRGANVGKAIAIGVATGAGVILSLFLIALQLD